MASGDEKREIRKGRLNWRRRGCRVESRDQARCESMCLHVVHSYQGDLPSYGKAFRCVYAGGKAGAHAGSASDGDKVRFALDCRRMAGYADSDSWGSLVWEGRQAMESLIY